MANYATQTKVSVAASKAEIEATLNRFGIRDVVFGTVDDGKLAAVMFQYQRRPYAISVKMPDPEERRFRHTPERGLERTQEQAYAAWEQACRVKWRELALLIKAKIVAVSNEAVNFEDEFLQTQTDPRKLKAYAVRASEHDDCQIVVIAHNRQEAKRLGFPVLCGWSDYCEYIDVRVRRIWCVDVPDRIIEPTVIEHCCGNEDWICAVWRYSEMCQGCVHQDAKREQEEDLYGDY